MSMTRCKLVKLDKGITETSLHLVSLIKFSKCLNAFDIEIDIRDTMTQRKMKEAIGGYKRVSIFFNKIKR